MSRTSTNSENQMHLSTQQSNDSSSNRTLTPSKKYDTSTDSKGPKSNKTSPTKTTKEISNYPKSTNKKHKNTWKTPASTKGNKPG